MPDTPLFVLNEDGELDDNLTAKERVLSKMTRWERWYTEKWVKAMAEALSAPIRTGGGPSADRVTEYGDRIVLDRLINLMRVSAQHKRQFDEAEHEGADIQELYRELGHEWKGAGNSMTNWEVCFLMSDASLTAPLRREAFEEYKRAFAHCFGLEAYVECFTEREPLRLDECRALRRAVGYDKLPPLDEDEQEWIAAFNRSLRFYDPGRELGQELFGPAFERATTVKEEVDFKYNIW